MTSRNTRSRWIAGIPKLAPKVDALNPAVLQLIAQTVKGAPRSSVDESGVCGGIASDPHAVPILVGLGVDELERQPAGDSQRSRRRSAA